MSDNAETDTAPGRQAKRKPAVDLKGMVVGELRQLIADAEAELRLKQEEARAIIRAKWEAEAAEAGLSIESIIPAHGARPKGRKTGQVPAKFRGPNGETWSGRGKLPGWLQAQEAEGRSRDQFLVKS